MPKSINGILLLNKPAEMTSNGALQRVKRLFNAKKAGHTGSLDPIATGMLPICFGEATKFSQFLLDSNKSYHVVAQLGIQTTTGDKEGEVATTSSYQHVTIADIERVMQYFHGEISQIPPMFSAIKHQGKPLYKLARQGIEVERQARKINIFTLMLENYDTESGKLTFFVTCSKGTYIRTLVEDIAHKLDCVAHVIELHRSSVSPYSHVPMHNLSSLESIAKTMGSDQLTTYLLPIETSVQVLPAIKLSTSAAFYLRMGQFVRATIPLATPFVRLLSEDARFLGIGEATSDGRIRPYRLLASQDIKQKQAV